MEMSFRSPSPDTSTISQDLKDVVNNGALTTLGVLKGSADNINAIKRGKYRIIITPNLFLSNMWCTKGSIVNYKYTNTLKCEKFPHSSSTRSIPP